MARRICAALLAAAMLLGCLSAASAYHADDWKCEDEAQLDSAWMCAYCKQNGINVTSAGQQEDCEHCVLQFDAEAGAAGEYTVGPQQASACYDCLASFIDVDAESLVKRHDCYNCSKYVENKFAAWACPWCANVTLNWDDTGAPIDPTADRKLACYECIQAIPADMDKDEAARVSAACVDAAYGRNYCNGDLGFVTVENCTACVAQFPDIITADGLRTDERKDGCYQTCTNTTLVTSVEDAVACMECITDPNVPNPWGCKHCMETFPAGEMRDTCFATLKVFDTNSTNEAGEHAWAVVHCLSRQEQYPAESAICLSCLAEGIDPKVCADARYNPATGEIIAADEENFVGLLALDCYNETEGYVPLDEGITAAECRTCQWNSAGPKVWACTALCRNETLIGDIDVRGEAMACTECVTSRPDPQCAWACQSCMQETLHLTGTNREDARDACYECVANNPHDDVNTIGQHDWACGKCARKSPSRRGPCIACLLEGRDSQECLNLRPT